MAAAVEPVLVGVLEAEQEAKPHAIPVEVLTAVDKDMMFVLVGIAPPPVLDDTIGVGLGMFEVLLYTGSLAGVVTFVVTLRKPII